MEHQLTKLNPAITQFLQSPIEYCKGISTSITKIEDAVKSETYLSQLKKDCPVQLNAVLVKFIEGMLVYLGRPREEIINQQCLMIINDILEKYQYLTLEDVCLCFKKARTSPNLYGKFYGKIDGSTILNWFAIYDKEREETIHSMPIETPDPFTGEEMSRDEYIECLKARIAGGDLYANADYLKAEDMRLKFDNSYELGNYKYHRKMKLYND